jgi:hypothetical protein
MNHKTFSIWAYSSMNETVVYNLMIKYRYMQKWAEEMQSVFIEPLFLNLLSKKNFIIYTSYLTTTDEKSVKRMCQNNHF